MDKAVTKERELVLRLNEEEASQAALEISNLMYWGFTRIKVEQLIRGESGSLILGLIAVVEETDWRWVQESRSACVGVSESVLINSNGSAWGGCSFGFRRDMLGKLWPELLDKGAADVNIRGTQVEDRLGKMYTAEMIVDLARVRNAGSRAGELKLE